MTNPFPYNQQISAYTPTAGKFEDYTFVVATCANGISAGVLKPNDDQSEDGSANDYNFKFVSQIDQNGSSNTTIEFINDANSKTQRTPYYFVAGSAENNLILYSFVPSKDPSQLSADCVTQMKTVITLDSPIASSVFCPLAQVLYVIGKNGKLTVLSVEFDSEFGIPSFTNRWGPSAQATGNPSGQIQSLLCADAGAQPFAVVTGLCEGKQNSLFCVGPENGEFFPLVGTPPNSVAVAATPDRLFVATASQIQSTPISTVDLSKPTPTMFDAPWTTVASLPPSITLTSLVYVPMSDSAPYPGGVLLAGGYGGTADNKSNDGMIFLFHPATGVFGELAGSVSGPVYGLLSDCAEHALFSDGSTGLGFLNLAPVQGASPLQMLVANSPESRGTLSKVAKGIFFSALVAAFWKGTTEMIDAVKKTTAQPPKPDMHALRGPMHKLRERKKARKSERKESGDKEGIFEDVVGDTAEAAEIAL